VLLHFHHTPPNADRAISVLVILKSFPRHSLGEQQKKCGMLVEFSGAFLFCFTGDANHGLLWTRSDHCILCW